MSELDRRVARHIVETVGAKGIPPQYGFQFFTAGPDPYVSVIEEEYLSTFIRDGGAAFKMVVSVYGGGKTHFLYCIRDLAWKHGFAVSYVSLSPEETPFHRLDRVYAAIARGLVPPLQADELLSGYEQGMAAFLRRWYAREYQEVRATGVEEEDRQSSVLEKAEHLGGVESISFRKAVSAAFRSVHEKQEQDFENICQWLSGEGYDRRTHSRYGILQRIDKSTAFMVIRSLVQWIRQIGYSGLVILLDEAERVPSLSTKQRERLLSNLRELIDECGHANFQGVMILYAVPDENFLEGRAQVYEALKQRLATVFDDTLNPSGVKIHLDKTIGETDEDRLRFLRSVGEKLTHVYNTAYDTRLDEEECAKTVDVAARTAYEERFGDIGYRRLFVQRLIAGLHFLRKKGVAPGADELR